MIRRVAFAAATAFACIACNANGVSTPTEPDLPRITEVANDQWAAQGGSGGCVTSNYRVIGKTAAMADVICGEGSAARSGSVSETTASGGVTFRVS